MMSALALSILEQVTYERIRQIGLFRGAKHSPAGWAAILLTKQATALKAHASGDPAAYRAEMVKVAAVAVAAIEAHDRRES
jgi:hypothetical protein